GPEGAAHAGPAPVQPRAGRQGLDIEIPFAPLDQDGNTEQRRAADLVLPADFGAPRPFKEPTPPPEPEHAQHNDQSHTFPLRGMGEPQSYVNGSPGDQCRGNGPGRTFPLSRKPLLRAQMTKEKSRQQSSPAPSPMQK